MIETSVSVVRSGVAHRHTVTGPADLRQYGPYDVLRLPREGFESDPSEWARWGQAVLHFTYRGGVVRWE